MIPILTMVLVLLSMIIYVMLPAPVVNVARYLTVLGMFTFAALVAFTMLVSELMVVI